MAQSDNIGPVMLKSGEYVVRKEAVDKLGKNTMDMINNADRLGYMGGGLVPQGQHGHSAIDELLALNTLNVQRNTDMTRQSAMMQKGGKIKPIMSKDDSNYSIGVVDELARALSDFEDMAPLMQIKNAKNRKQALSDAQEAGMIMSNKDALNALMQVANSYYRDREDSNNMKGAQSFQNGGYGSMSTQDYQQQYGKFIEDDVERRKYEDLYGVPDVSDFLEDRDRFGADARNQLMFKMIQAGGNPEDEEFQQQLSPDKLKTLPEIEVSAAWVNYMQPGDYNPIHIHKNCEFSGVIYIDIPKKLQKEISEYKGTIEGPGTIVFLYGEDARHCQTMKTFVPVTGDFYMFPYMLRHGVNPHKSNCERVSIGVNFDRKGGK